MGRDTIQDSSHAFQIILVVTYVTEQNKYIYFISGQ